MPNGNESGMIPTGNVSPTGQTQQAITEPEFQQMAAGQDLINTAIAGDDQQYLSALRNVDNAVIGRMQQRWWKSQDEQFLQTQGQSYQLASQNLQASYMDELARASDIKDPWERDAAMNAAHGRMWSELGKIDQNFLDQASKYANNPIIGNRVSRLIQQRTELIGKIAGERAQPAQQAQTLSTAEQAQATAGAQRATAEKTRGFYSSSVASVASRVPISRARDFIITQPGGREELQSEIQHLMAERETLLAPAYRQYQEALSSGNMKLARQAAAEFRKMFLVDPEMFGDKDSEEIINLWRSEALPKLEKEAAENIYNRLIDASRGFQPGPGTKAPQAPGAPALTPGGLTKESGKPPAILGKGAPPEAEEQARFARRLGETREMPEFDIPRAMQAMGGGTTEEVEVSGQKAYNFMAQQMIREGLEPPARWDSTPSVEVTEFAQDAYSDIPSYREATTQRKKTEKGSAQMQKYLDGLSDQIKAVFMLPDSIPNLPAGLDRDDIVWMNLITLHAQFLRKYPDSDISIEQMVEGALSNVAQRGLTQQKLEERNKRLSPKKEESKPATPSKPSKEKLTGRKKAQQNKREAARKRRQK